MPEGPVYRPTRGTGMDPTTRRLALIAGTMGVGLFLLVGGYSVVKGTHGRSGGAIPLIAPPPGPLKVRPANPGGLQVLGADPPPATDGTSAETLAPGPERADPAALAAALAQARASATPPPPVPTDHSATRPAPSAGGAAPPAPLLPNGPPPAAAPAAPSVPVALPDAGPGAAAQAGRNRVTVQLGALSSEADAHAEWRRLAARGKALFDGRTLTVMPVAHEGHTLWRIRTGGFGSVADANAFCTKVRALGGACNVATF